MQASAPAASVLGYETIRKIQVLSEEFDELCQKRYNMGEQKYGAGTWLGVDNAEMAIEELIDMANYLRFMFVRLRLVQETLGTDRSTAAPKPGNEMMGKDAFTSAVRRSE